jgi:lysophospholipase L1-like esterase
MIQDKFMMKFIFSFPIFLTAAGMLLAAENVRPVGDTSTASQREPANQTLPTFHIVGDSTVRSGGTSGMRGWGERILPFFDASKIQVMNHAIGGRSARTFFGEGRWQKVVEAMKPGDSVIIQFGHNDVGRIGDPAFKGRPNLPGTGDETVEDLKPDGTREVVHTFGWYLKKFVADAQARKVTVILCSPIPHKKKWENERDFENIAKWTSEVARSNSAHYIDLTYIISEAYKRVGRGVVETYFADKETHTNDAGARFNAACVVFGLASLPGNPLGRYFKLENKGVMKFSFGRYRMDSGSVTIGRSSLYSDAKGYGFEPGAEINEGNGISSDRPFLFSVRLPEGNYSVTAVFGSDTDASVTTVKSEQRRLMLEDLRMEAGQFAARSFMAHVHTPAIRKGEKVALKARELATEKVNWDDKLTLEFNGKNPALRYLEITPVQVPTLFITGDSTVSDQPAEPWNSWGQMLPRFFKPDMVVANYAQSGESIASSLGSRRFEKVFSVMKPGDYLLVQFGHNDQKSKREDALSTYEANLRNLVARTRALRGVPILVTSMERKSGVAADTLGAYPETVRKVAREEKCAWIDLHAMSRTLYQALGSDLGRAFQDGTHHNNYGSYQLAKCVMTGIRKSGLPLAESIAEDFPHYDPAKPDSVHDFEMPLSPSSSVEKPLGD